jgi:hypothetical protein
MIATGLNRVDTGSIAAMPMDPAGVILPAGPPYTGSVLRSEQNAALLFRF